MFTGIITAVGTIIEAKGSRVAVSCPYADIAIGESIAVNGCCLTVVEKREGAPAFDLSPETFARTVPRWHKGARVNLERALRVGDSLSGHFVTGHVDGAVKLLEVTQNNDAHLLSLEAPVPLLRYLAEKGSVTLDGVSLTVNRVESARFEVCIIPHTWRETTLSERKPGDEVNLEVDMIARYLERLRQG